MSFHRITLFAGTPPARWVALIALAVILLAGGLSAFAEDALEIATDRSVVSVRADQQPVLVYQCSERPRKPYLKELFSPSGVNVLRDAPADHLHHHGLMFAVAVEGVDFWSENEKCGFQRHRALEDVRTYVRDGLNWAAFTQPVEWLAPDGKRVLLDESRKLDVCRLDEEQATLLLWRCRLEAPAEMRSVTLSGSPYFGLGMRFVQSMDTGGRFQNAEGKTGVEGTNDVRSAWCAYWAAAEEKPVTVAIFDHPKNARHPATWFTMDSAFAYLAVTLNLNKEPLQIQRGEPLELRYAAALWDGHVEPERIRKTYQRLIRWASESEEP